MPSWSRWWPEQVYELVRLWPSARMILIRCAARYSAEKVWRMREQAPKTLNAIRPVDIPESLAQVLCRYIKGRKGHRSRPSRHPRLLPVPF